ncbi:MAG TPA: DUF5719 family protein [Acidimicrobiales bacterium]|nr:DUF5719 family protein [Acidimicrobiales bacterium]
MNGAAGNGWTGPSEGGAEGARHGPLRSGGGRHDATVRLPAIAVIAVVLLGAVVLDRSGNDRPGAAAPAPAARPEAVVPAAVPATAGSSTWYCAAGTAVDGGDADHHVVLVNLGEEARRAVLTVFAGARVAPAEDRGGDPGGDGVPVDGEAGGSEDDRATTTTATASTVPPAPAAPVQQEVELPAGGRVAVRLADLVQAPLAAALVEVDGGGVAVEHGVSGPAGADLAPCASSASPAWHFAWGETARDARETVVLFNPFPTDATVDTTFVTEDGGRRPVRFQGIPVPAGGVVGVDLGEEVTRSDEVAATFDVRGGRIVVERIQQFDGSLGRAGLSLTLGVPEPAATWVFADGEASGPSPAAGDPDGTPPPTTSTTSTTTTTAGAGGEDRAAGGTAEKIVVYNPGDRRAEVAVTVLPATDEPAPLPQPFGLSVGPGDYEVVDYGGEDRIEAGVGHTTVVRVTAGEGVVAERVTMDTDPGEPSADEARDEGDRDGRDRDGSADGGEAGAEAGGGTEVTAAPGARFAARSWMFPSATEWEAAATIVVFNPDPHRFVAATLRPAAPGAGPIAGPVELAPGGRATIAVDPGLLPGGTGLVVDAARPVVAERLLVRSDGARLALGPGIPAVDTAVGLDGLAAGAGLAGAALRSG